MRMNSFTNEQQISLDTIVEISPLVIISAFGNDPSEKVPKHKYHCDGSTDASCCSAILVRMRMEHNRLIGGIDTRHG
jgi:hypothetical protein